MNDEQVPRLDPEQEERVRALLADLGGTSEAIPPEVSARLDETLADLVAERGEVEAPPTGSNVLPLRRRWAPRAAAAAAAVIVVGAGGVAAANLGLLGGGTSASDKATSGSAGGQAESLDSAGTPAPSQPDALSGRVPARLPRVSAASFEADVARLLQRTPAAQYDANERKSQAGSGADTLAAACPGPKVDDRSRTTPVSYDGNPAVLVIHPEHGGQRLVEAWSCAGHRLDSAHIAAGLGSPSPTP